METNHPGTGYFSTQDHARLLATNKTIQKVRERIIEFSMFLCALSSVAITLGIVGILLFESWNFFKHVSLFDFLTDTQWTVLFESPVRYHAIGHGHGRNVSRCSFVACPGHYHRVYLSEYANNLRF